jgi:hypothetical protein
MTDAPTEELTPTTFIDYCDGCINMLYAQMFCFGITAVSIIIGMIFYTLNKNRHPLNKR